MSPPGKALPAPSTGHRQPSDAELPFTIGSLRKAVPAHCFERSLLRSSLYLLADLTAVALLVFACLQIDRLPWWAAGAAWPVYWFCQGAVCVGVWVLAHECGHQAFSRYQVVNDSVGLVLHSCLLVPYYSWKHSHRRHHSNTGSAEKDEVFVPRKRPAPDAGDPELRWMDFGPVRLAEMAFVLTAGWPLYLVSNASGRKYGRWASHFDPYSPIYSRRERTEVMVSDFALTAAASGLWALARAFGWAWLLKVYIMPYLVVNFWLVMITLLQHTHPALPHYDGGEWAWLRGALATVDRSFGRVLDAAFHHIADTHVAHHLFSQMPHYHAQEASKALIPFLDKFYARDERNVFSAMYSDWVRTRYVAPDTQGSGVFWYRSF